KRTRSPGTPPPGLTLPVPGCIIKAPRFHSRFGFAAAGSPLPAPPTFMACSLFRAGAENQSVVGLSRPSFAAFSFARPRAGGGGGGGGGAAACLLARSRRGGISTSATSHTRRHSPQHTRSQGGGWEGVLLSWGPSSDSARASSSAARPRRG